MGLADRLKSPNGVSNSNPAPPPGSLAEPAKGQRPGGSADSERVLKNRVHNRLFETIDVAKLEALDPAAVSSKVSAAINGILTEDGRVLTDNDRNRLVDEI